MFEFHVPKGFRILFFVILLLLPTAYIASQYSPETHFTSLIYFGQKFSPNSLKEVCEIPRSFAGTDGYDGQFYAQIALDPSLRDPQFRFALDNPRYRAKRIFVPVLSYALGLGQPWLIVQVYALVNMLFYVLLLGGLIYFLKPRTVKDLLGIGAIMWTTGCLVSVQRSLLDLPAAVLIFLAASVRSTTTFPLMSAAVLSKETSLLSILAAAWPRSWRGQEIVATLLLAAGAIIVPFLCWSGYVSSIFGGSIIKTIHSHRAVEPLTGIIDKLYNNSISLFPHITEKTIAELLATLSLIVEAIYVMIKPRLDSPYWRMGIGFALLYFFLTEAVFVNQLGYTRIVLPLTISFNLLLMRHEQRSFIGWFCVGNLGLAGLACVWLLKIF